MEETEGVQELVKARANINYNNFIPNDEVHQNVCNSMEHTPNVIVYSRQ